MSKDDAVRVSDTIAFIRTANVPPAHQPKRAIIADFLEDRNDDGKIPNIISTAMSQGHNYAIMGRDEVKEQRAYRRAIILIRSMLLGVDRNMAAQETAQIADAALPAALGNVLADATGLIDDATAKLAELKAQPLNFLAHYNLQMVGLPTSAPYDYAFYFDRLNGLYTFAPPDQAGNWVFITEPVYQVNVQSYGALPRTARGGGADWRDVAGTVVHGADLMVTTQLTGCAVVYHLNGGHLVAAHVQPTGGANAEAMCTDLRANARLAAAPNITGIFGAQNPKGVDPNNYLKAGYYNYCIGVRRGGAWELYAQQRPRAYGDNVGAGISAWQIT